MQVVFHLGAHSTDEDRLITTLAANQEVLAQVGAVVPAPRAYRGALRDALIALKGQPADPETQASLLATCLGDAAPEGSRLIFSHPNFLGLYDRAVTEAGFYASAPAKLEPLANLFPDAQAEFHLGLINPATLVSALVARAPERSYDDFMAGQTPESLRWAPVVREMIAAARGLRFVVWCNEDQPLIFPEVLRSLGGIPAETPLAGEDSLLEEIMTREGMTRLRGYMAQHPPQSVAQRRKVVSAFLDKFARPETLEVELSLPGWTEDLVAQITRAYEADVAEIAAMEGVTFIAP